MMRMSTSGRATVLVALLALPVLLAGCTERGEPAAEGDAPQYGGTVVVIGSSDVENMNAFVSNDRFTQDINRHVLFLPLVRYDDDLEYEPVLAERWEMLGDTGVIMHIRQDVRWHDGVRVTARDVLFTYERVIDPETAYPDHQNFENWTAGVLVDSFTVRFAFTPHLEPLGGLPLLPIMPAHLLDSIPAARMRQIAFNKNPVGNGPFRFVEHRPNDRTVFAANEDFPEALGGRPWIDRLVWRGVPDATAQVAEITAGAADIVLSPPATQFPQLARQPGLRGVTGDGRVGANIIWNTRVAPLNDARVRRAIALAIDRQQILQALRGGYGSLAVGPIGDWHWGSDNDIEPLPFSPDSARALLDAAGLRDTDGDGVRELANGRRAEIEIKFPATSVISRDMTELIRAQLAAVGLRVSSRPTDYPTLLQDVQSPQRNFHGALLGWESSFRINLRDPFHSATTSTPNNVSSYSNPQVDSLIDRLAVVRSREEAAPLYAEVQRILRDEQPWLFLYYYPDLVLVRDRLQNVRIDIRGTLVNVQQWWVTNPRTAPAAPGDSADRGPAPDSAPAR
jgi:peptide/nickel transport system substrate-binding protein